MNKHCNFLFYEFRFTNWRAGDPSMGQWAARFRARAGNLIWHLAVVSFISFTIKSLVALIRQ